jgi:photosystem II stability/assembly factor-like uncharacterized protein
MHLHTVVLGGRPGVIYLGTHYGLFISNDGGHTWPQARGILHSLMITVVAINARDTSSLALVGIPSVSGSAEAGIYFSQDTGTTWNLRQPAALPDAAYPFTVQAGSAGSGHFYAFYLYAGWYETRDAGLHWRSITGNMPSNTQNRLVLTFPGDPDHLLLGGDAGVFESKDDGTHWTKLTSVHGSVQALTTSSQNPATIYCATDQGLFKWQQNTSTAIQAVQLPAGGTASFARIAVDASGKILYGLTGRDLWYSNNAGLFWTKRYHFERGDSVALLIDPQDPQRVYIGFFLPPKVDFSVNGGSSWRILSQ